MKKQWLFSYGTIQDVQIQKMLFGHTCIKKNAELPGWSLYASFEEGYLFIKPESSGIVAGCILEVDQYAIHTADQWEEVPFYTREKVSVLADNGSRQDAWVYTRSRAKGTPYAGNRLSLLDRPSILAQVASLKKQKERMTLPFCDVSVMVPCAFLTGAASRFHPWNQDASPDLFLQTFREVAGDPFSQEITSEVTRFFLTEIEIITWAGNELKSEAGRQRIRTYLTEHEKTGVAIITFLMPACSVSVHELLNQMVQKEIGLRYPGESQKITPLIEWIHTLGLVQTGAPRWVVLLSAEPSRSDLLALIAAAEPVEGITGPEMNPIVSKKRSDDKNSRIYVSKTGVVEIPARFGDTYEDRMVDSVLTLFKLELRLFQEALLIKAHGL